MVGIPGLGQAKESNYNGFKDRDDEECEHVEDDQAQEAAWRRVLRWARSRGGPGGAVNEYTFRKFSQIVFSQGFASAKRLYFRKLSQICFRKNT